jgi:hypothetical protein
VKELRRLGGRHAGALGLLRGAWWEALIGQMAAIHFQLVPLLADRTEIPFQLTIGWIERDGEPIYQHRAELIQRSIDGQGET